MRLFLLPISTSRSLIYAQRINHQLSPNPTLVERAVTKATAQWSKWEAADKGWQKKITDYGNGAFARIPYQEWGLKSIPPLSTRRKKEELKGKEHISVSFPTRIIKHGDVLGVLRGLATERQGLHRKAMWYSIVGLPVALPFGLIPVLPNLPFIYLLFRAWSHWRALNGSKHIEFLLDNNLVKLAPSDLIQRAYDVQQVPQERMDQLKELATGDVTDAVRTKTVLELLGTKAGPVKPEQMPEDKEHGRILLPVGTGKLVSRAIGIPALDVEIERAVAQVSSAIEKEKEAQKLDSAEGEKKEKDAKAEAEKEA